MARLNPFQVRLRAIKAKFFDRPILEGVEKANKHAMSKFGAFVMRDSRRSMRNARKVKRLKNSRVIYRNGKPIRISNKPSKPGSPPRSITGHIKRNIFFSYEAKSGGVVIGPEIIPSKTKTRQPVPAMHEQNIDKGHAIVRRRIDNRIVTQKYPKRPAMVPAHKKNVKKLPELYRNRVRR